MSKAKTASGVLLVLRIYQQLLQSDKARFVGDRIAFVVAEARDAADMVEVHYEPLPAVALLEDAVKDGAPKCGTTIQTAMSRFN